LSFRTWDVDQNAMIDSGDATINRELQYPRANARALGLPIDPTFPGPDAELRWSEYFLDNIFDFDRSDGVDGSDFLGVAIHELGHALGFGSGVDAVDGVFAGFIPVPRDEIPEYAVLFPLDLFRYTAESLPVTDLTPGGAPYFSLDGGATSLARFATGESFGDGWQAGHWQLGPGYGIMEARLADDAVHQLTELDLRAMDVIGWDRRLDADFDGDGSVDADDLAAWASNFGLAGGASHDDGDADLDGDVDGADFLIWQREIVGAPQWTPIAEPANTALGLLAVACLGCFRRRLAR
jgi:hypothetical protein